MLVYAKEPLLNKDEQRNIDLEANQATVIKRVNLKEAKLLGAKKKFEAYDEKRKHEIN